MNCRFVSISLALSLSVCLSLVSPLSTAQTSAPNVSAMPRLVPFDCMVRDCNKNPLSGGTKLGGATTRTGSAQTAHASASLRTAVPKWTYLK
jgi:hypothetical protein